MNDSHTSLWALGHMRRTLDRPAQPVQMSSEPALDTKSGCAAGVVIMVRYGMVWLHLAVLTDLNQEPCLQS
jgi:hypothetical protein